MAKTLESVTTITPEKSSELSLLIPNPPNDERARAITEIIVQVEMTKQLARPISDKERNVLMRLLADTGETISEIRERAKRLLRRITYGNIAFEHWMAEEDTIKAKWNCSYCGTEWWGPAGSKCPDCFGKPR